MIISKSVTLKTLVVFFSKSLSQTPGARFLGASYNELTGFFSTKHLKFENALGIDINSNLNEGAIAHFSFAKWIAASPDPLARFKCSFVEKLLLVRCMKRLTKSSRGSLIMISKKMNRVLKATHFELIVCPPILTLKLKLKTDINYM